MLIKICFDTTINNSPNATVGHRIYFNTIHENIYFKYAMPLIGILGSESDKMIPVGAFYSLRLELLINSFSNFVIDSTVEIQIFVQHLNLNLLEI